MSTIIQNEFENQVIACFWKHANRLSLCEPLFSRNGYVITATMVAGTAGKVELRCGPSEYTTEIFVYTSTNNERWSLVDLLRKDRIRTWMLQNRSNLAGKSRLEAEVACAFSLLADGLKGIPEFKWVNKKA